MRERESPTVVGVVVYWRRPSRSTFHRDWHTAYAMACWTGV